MEINRGDSIIFGENYCKRWNLEYLIGKTIKLTPQYFDNDNGLYSYEEECPGIYNEVDEEADSIYHLFGNDFEYFMDCKLIKGTEKDKEEYEKIIKDKEDKEMKSWQEFMEESKAEFFANFPEEKFGEIKE